MLLSSFLLSFFSFFSLPNKKLPPLFFGDDTGGGSSGTGGACIGVIGEVVIDTGITSALFVAWLEPVLGLFTAVAVEANVDVEIEVAVAALAVPKFLFKVPQLAQNLELIATPQLMQNT